MASAFQNGHGQDNWEAAAAPYPDLLHTLLWNAVLEKATDVHLHCVEDGIRVLYRVDGAIHLKQRMASVDGRRLLNQLKSAAGLSAVRTFAPQEGHVIWRDGHTRWEIRVTLTPVAGRDSAHLRMLSAPRDEWDLPELGLGADDHEKITSTIRSLNGLVLVTGATGSGKTTTMYCLASLLDLSTTTAYSIEDPVEFRLPYAQQIEVDEQHGLTMHEGLRTILRMDPDLILVGEIRDADSAIVAARAALSGRLVLATIHAQDAAGAVDALQYLGVPPHILGGSLRMIIAQNLVRRLCPCCAQPHDPTEEHRELFSRLGLEPLDGLLQAEGCIECCSYGYRGRMGVFETVIVDDEIGTLISSGTHHGELASRLRATGVQSMIYDGLKKALVGVTSVEEVLRVCGQARDGELLRRGASAASFEMVAR